MYVVNAALACTIFVGGACGTHSDSEHIKHLLKRRTRRHERHSSISLATLLLAKGFLNPGILLARRSTATVPGIRRTGIPQQQFDDDWLKSKFDFGKKKKANPGDYDFGDYDPADEIEDGWDGMEDTESGNLDVDKDADWDGMDMERYDPKKGVEGINEDIVGKFREVRVTRDDSDADGDEPLGIMSSEEAWEMAQEEETDLILITEDADPPVVKLMDYNKYKYKMEQKLKQAKKAQGGRKQQVKEIRLGPNMGKADFDNRLKQARKFLGRNDRVKFVMQFKGREQMFEDDAKNKMLAMGGELKDVSKIEGTVSKQGQRMVLLLAPTKKK